MSLDILDLRVQNKNEILEKNFFLYCGLRFFKKMAEKGPLKTLKKI